MTENLHDEVLELLTGIVRALAKECGRDRVEQAVKKGLRGNPGGPKGPRNIGIDSALLYFADYLYRCGRFPDGTVPEKPVRTMNAAIQRTAEKYWPKWPECAKTPSALARRLLDRHIERAGSKASPKP